MDDGLVLHQLWSWLQSMLGLNPYCSGRWSRTSQITVGRDGDIRVLILIVVDDGLVLISTVVGVLCFVVLILIVVDDGLVP